MLAPEAKTVPHQGPEPGGRTQWTLEPGEEFMALWGSGYDRARAFIEIEHRGKLLQSFWTEAGATQQPVKQAVTEAMRGGFTLHVTMVRENRGYLESAPRRRALDQQEPDGEMGAFRLQADENLARSRETLDRRDQSHGPRNRLRRTAKAVAEMVAALYDQSLDAYLPHAWQAGFGVFRQDWSRMNEQFENMAKYLNQLQGGWPLDQRDVQITYRSLAVEHHGRPLGLRLLWWAGRKRTDDRARRRQAPGGMHSSDASCR